MMENQNLEQVKELIEEIANSYSPPTEEQTSKMQILTGNDWCAEDLQMMCCEYWSHNSLNETAYLMFHEKLPTVTETKLAFWRCKPGAVLDDEAVFEKYRLGGTMKALEILPEDDILAALRSLPDWEEVERDIGDSRNRRFNSLQPMEYWHDVHFWFFPYGTKAKELQMVCISCQDASEGQIMKIIDAMDGLSCPLHLRK